MNEKRYKATLNWYGEVIVFWTHANSMAQAKSYVLRNFAKEIGMVNGPVISYFDGNKDNFKIEEA